MTEFVERKGFRFSDDECYNFVFLDTPLYKKQIELITEELNEHFSRQDEFKQFVWEDLCMDVQPDNYGSIRFHWKKDVMEWFTDEQLEQINHLITEAFGNTDWCGQLALMRSYSQGDEEIHSEDDVDNYLETVRECGYKIDWEDEKDVIPSRFHNYVDQLALKEKLIA